MHYQSVKQIGSRSVGPDLDPNCLHWVTSFVAANMKRMKHLHVQLGLDLLSITTPVSLLGNEFDVRNILHTQMSLAAVIQIHIFHEAINGCKNQKIH